MTLRSLPPLLLSPALLALRHHVPFPARVHREHAVRPRLATGHVLGLPSECEERSGRELLLLAVDCEGEGARYDGAGVVGGVVVQRGREAARELEEEVAGPFARIAVYWSDLYASHARDL